MVQEGSRENTIRNSLIWIGGVLCKIENTALKQNKQAF